MPIKVILPGEPDKRIPISKGENVFIYRTGNIAYIRPMSEFVSFWAKRANCIVYELVVKDYKLVHHVTIRKNVSYKWMLRDKILVKTLRPKKK